MNPLPSSVAFMVLQFHLLLISVFAFNNMQQKRLTLLMASALFQGASVGPLIDLAIQIDPRYAFITFTSALGFFFNFFQRRLILW